MNKIGNCFRSKNNMKKTGELFRFGVIADIQYADIDDAFSFNGKQRRLYRDSLVGAAKAVKCFNEANVDFVAQVGDIIDGQNAGKYGQLKGHQPQSEKALVMVLEQFKSLDKSIPVYHSIGNHELYNFSWEQLSEKLNCSEKQYKVSENGKFYFSVNPKPDDDVSWKIIQLNPYEVSLMQSKHTEGFQKAKDILQKYNPNFSKFYPEFDDDLETPTEQVNFGLGLPEDKKHMVPYNGGIGEDQMVWLEQQLSQCKLNQEKAIILTHIPLKGEAATHSTVVFNADRIISLFKKYNDVVRLVVSGHAHDGGYFFDESLQIGFVTLQAPLVFGESHGIIRVFEDAIRIEGFGGVPSREIHF